jgi:glycosyltransferase involved in cell wall biosynthesis
MGRIIYVTPRTKAPVGGIRTMYRHVARLRHHGFDAYLYHVDQGYRPDWFREDVPMLYTADLRAPDRLRLEPDDHIVFYESASNSIRFFSQYKGATRHLFCQNHFLMFAALDELGVANWQALGVERCFASAGVIARAAEACLGFRAVPIVPYAIDHAQFRPGPKRLQIAFMPRKRSDDIGFIRRCFAGAFPDLAHVEWVEIHNQGEERAAEILRESAAFLSLGRREGFGLPPVEAMACGCLVAGFLGVGGREFATDANGLWCEDDDLVGAALRLGQAVRRIECRDRAADAMIAAGRQTAVGYTVEAMDVALIGYWRNTIGL